MRKPRKPPATQEDFDRFKEFARRLIAVPKKEVDREEEKYQKEKQTKRKK